MCVPKVNASDWFICYSTGWHAVPLNSGIKTGQNKIGFYATIYIYIYISNITMCSAVVISNEVNHCTTFIQHLDSTEYDTNYTMIISNDRLSKGHARCLKHGLYQIQWNIHIVLPYFVLFSEHDPRRIFVVYLWIFVRVLSKSNNVLYIPLSLPLYFALFEMSSR